MPVVTNNVKYILSYDTVANTKTLMLTTYRREDSVTGLNQASKFIVGAATARPLTIGELGDGSPGTLDDILATAKATAEVGEASVPSTHRVKGLKLLLYYSPVSDIKKYTAVSVVLEELATGTLSAGSMIWMDQVITSAELGDGSAGTLLGFLTSCKTAADAQEAGSPVLIPGGDQ